MKNLFRLLFLLLTVGILLVGCKTPSTNPPTDEPPAEVPAGTIFSPDIAITVVKADSGDGGFSTEVQGLVSRLTGKNPQLVNPGALPAAHEIIVGACERPVAKTASEKLAALVGEGGEGDSAWVIYAEGGSIAIVYNCKEAMNMAFEYFRNNMLTADTLVYETAYEQHEAFVLRDFYREAELAEIEKSFEELKTILDENTVIQLRKLYELYSDELLVWLAGLYDPTSSGFYYSNSARDTTGFAPDVKSTGDAVFLMQHTGMGDSSGGLRRALNKTVANGIAKFLQQRQSKSSSYFINPGYGIRVSDQRLKIDLFAALQAIAALGQKPSYRNYPSSYAGQSIYVTLPIVGRSSKLAARGILDDIIDTLLTPEHMKSEEAFAEYLGNIDILGDTYAATARLEDEWSTFVEYGFDKQAIDYLISLQNTENGLFDPVTNLDSLRRYIMIAQLLLVHGASLPNADKTTASAIEVLTTITETENITDAAVSWFVLSLTAGNPAEDTAEAVRGAIAENRVKMITKTESILAQYKKADGSFSYYKDQNLFFPYSMQLAVAGVNEGDLPSTTIAAAQIPSLIYQVLGVGKFIPIYTKTDLDVLTENMLANEPIEKADNEAAVYTHTFEGDEVGKAPSTVHPSLNSPAPGHAVIASEDGNKYLELVSVKGKGYGDSILVTRTPGKSGEGIAFEADFRIAQSNDIYVIQITLASSYLISMSVKDGAVTIFDVSQYSDPKFTNTFNQRVNVGEWFKLRVEYFVDGDKARALVILNGVHIATTDNYINKGGEEEGAEPLLPQKISGDVRIYTLHASDITLHIDNVRLESVNPPEDLYDRPLFDGQTVKDPNAEEPKE